MKKSASNANRSASPKKSPGARSRAGQRSESLVGSDSATCVRLEVTPPTRLPLPETPVPPVATSRRRVRFGYFKPEASEVYLVGSFNGWNPRITPLRRDSLGDWSVEMELPTGEHRYRFVVDGEWCDDPAAQQTTQNPYGGFDAIMVVV